MKTEFNVPANPAKAFFVEMITRDIELQDAILDLLDNCVDGIRRSAPSGSSKPFAEYFANIDFDQNRFVIEDNCGGIPKQIAEKYAFMMGRPASEKGENSGSIGVYGIGMKRAIFKMGRSCVVHSHTRDATFEVKITKDWLEDDSDWNLTATSADKSLSKYGTKITVKHLHETIQDEFAEGSDFRMKFPGIVRDAYSFLLEKGFKVKINGEEIKPLLPVLLWDASGNKGTLKPYIYQAEIGNVKVLVTVGFREKPESRDSNEEEPSSQYRSEDAGWTIVCNDRVVLPYDKTRQTGWGWGGVPKYHTQFIAISGFVVFSGPPRDLPMTTTKRGVDANSPLYAEVRTKMQEGLLLFTKFTNDWKGADNSHVFKKARRISVTEILKQAKKENLRFAPIRGDGKQSQIIPDLPKKPSTVLDKQISFRRPIKEIEMVSKWLFDSNDYPPSEVGSGCFDFVLRKIK